MNTDHDLVDVVISVEILSIYIYIYIYVQLCHVFIFLYVVAGTYQDNCHQYTAITVMEYLNNKIALDQNCIKVVIVGVGHNKCHTPLLYLNKSGTGSHNCQSNVTDSLQVMQIESRLKAGSY